MLIFRYNGNLLASPAQTIVNTVNCVGVMGKGIALEFKRAYPAMYQDYVARCRAQTVHPGRPYLYRDAYKQILNFPTKAHWRDESDLAWVQAGLVAIREHYDAWGIQSLAIPPLGCGNGGLRWDVVRPIIIEVLGDLPIAIEIYEPR